MRFIIQRCFKLPTLPITVRFILAPVMGGSRASCPGLELCLPSTTEYQACSPPD